VETRNSTYSFSDAITDLRNAEFQVEPKAYGFSVVLQDSRTKYYVECGHEHYGGISISVNSGTPPVTWFVRPSIQEMVELLTKADKLLKSGKAVDWIDSLNKIEPMVRF